MLAGISLSQVLAVLIPVGIVTVVLRQLPFSFIKMMRGSPLVGTLAHVGQADAGGCDGNAGYLYDFPAAIQY